MAETAVSEKRKIRRRLFGVVIRAHKAAKTIRVEVKFSRPHPKYGKYVRRSIKVLAHDEEQVAQEGNQVEIAECRPISKTKNWRLVRVISER